MERILWALVGSQEHGLATPTSDYDYRGVFVLPTKDFLRVDAHPKQTQFDVQSGEKDNTNNKDNTSHELGLYLSLALKGNPSVLEVLCSSTYEANQYGERLRALFPLIWNSRGVYDSFRGYGRSQKVKALDEEKGAGGRINKFATAWIRTLYGAHELLTCGTFTMNVTGTSIEPICRRFRAGNFTQGEMVDICHEWELKVDEAYRANPNKASDVDAVNEFLFEVRRDYWDA